MNGRSRWPVSVRGGVALLVLALATSLLHAEPRQTVHIPPQPLAQALLELGRQTGLSIVFARSLVADRRTDGVTGRYTPREALAKLLAPAGLTFEMVHGEIAAIRPATPRRKAREDASHPELAAMLGYRAPPGIEEVRVTARAVTGSRIRRIDYYGTASIDVIDLDELTGSGVQSLGEVLKALPAVAGNSTSTQVTNGGDGTATVTLRGLPAANTLVLVNGRRVNFDALKGAAADLNSIPLALIDRVEILKDGASAIYGSDAIAGVVNIITRQRVQGLTFGGFAGIASRGDLRTSDLSVLYGRGGEQRHFTLGATWYEQRPLYSRDRRISRSADDRPRGGIDKRSSATAPARITLADGPVILASNDLDGSSPADFRPATPEDRFEFRDFTTAVVPSERYGLYAEGRSESSLGEWFGELQYSETRARNTLAPTPVFTAFEIVPLPVSADNPFNPFGVEIEDLRRRMVELPPREQIDRTQSMRFVLGLSGSGERLRWEAALQGARSQAREATRHLLIASRLQQSLGPAAGCAAPCVPVNLFGPPGSVTDEMLDWIRTDSYLDGQSDLFGGSLILNSHLLELPAGRLEVAAGLEYRRERLRTRPGVNLLAADTIGGVNTQATDGDRDIFEAFAEAYLPLARDRFMAESLDLEASGRVSRYSDFGFTANPRLGLSWRVHPSLLVRATWGRGFRAPTLRQLHIGLSQNFEFLSDPCAAEDISALPGCAQRSDPTLTQFLVLTGGNPNLAPERSRNLSAGLVWTPEIWRGLEISVNLWRIRQTNVVDSSSQFIINSNARFGTFGDRVARNRDGNLRRILATQLNIGGRETEGFDLRGSWRTFGRFGEFEIAANAAHIARFVDRLDPTTPAIDQAGTFMDDASSGNGALPDWKVTAGLEWRYGPWNTIATVRHVSSLREVVPIIGRRRRISPWTTLDMQVRYLFSGRHATAVSLGMNNVFDRDPPFVAAAFNDSFDARTYELAGRFVYLRIAADFARDGQ